jgi:septal ring factor EnvC (AmiA/AmiB activator)
MDVRSSDGGRTFRVRSHLNAFAALMILASAIGIAQTPTAPDRAQTEALARRASARIQALQREADALASQERTLLVELERLEVERRLRQEEFTKVGAEADAVTRELADTAARIRDLEQHEQTERPGVEQRLVDVYKLGRGGYLRMLLSVDDLRSAGRAYRTVASLSVIDRARVQEHRRSLQQLRAASKTLADRRTKLLALQQSAQRARAAADRATTMRAALVERIDEERDLNAQLAGELQTAQHKLQQALAAMAAGRPAVEHVSLPLRPFKGDLDWPAPGPILQRFGGSRFGASVPRSGIEIGGTDGTPVTAVHDGTVAFADPFIGFGNLVIVDHGNQAFSLYGHLAGLDVSRGDRVSRGQRLGQVGSAPAGPAGLYFELRIDAKPVDPLQWLKVR